MTRYTLNRNGDTHGTVRYEPAGNAASTTPPLTCSGNRRNT